MPLLCDGDKHHADKLWQWHDFFFQFNYFPGLKKKKMLHSDKI